MAIEDEQKSSRNQPEGERRFSQKQYDMLKRCCDKEDMTEWNKWRIQNPGEDVLLEGADFSFFYLRRAHLNQVTQYDEQTGKILKISNKVCLKRAIFVSAKLEGANLSWADLEKANFLETLLDNARLRGARLKNAIAMSAYFQRTNLSDAILEGANLQGAYLEGAYISSAHLEGANFHLAHVDSSTLIWVCNVDRKTNFLGVALDVAKIDPATKQLLEYNIRRKNWEVWYKEHWLLQWPVKLFWSFSDYGISTWRIIGWFFLLALAFAAIYANCACWWPPGIVNNLEVEPHLPLWHYFLLVILRPVYFSIVTMTTLGFGDMHANEASILGHALLTLQVILGYVLLGALVTRFAVLFTAGGPAGKFSPIKTKEKGDNK